VQDRKSPAAIRPKAKNGEAMIEPSRALNVEMP